MIKKGKAVHLSRPVQKLFPIEIRTGTSEISEIPKERVTGPQRRDVPRRSAALDVVWKTRAMENQPNDLTLGYVCAYLDSNPFKRGGSVGKHLAHYATQHPLP